MIRSILSVIAGYAVFAVSGVMLFSASGFNPHGEVPTWFLAASITYGIVFAALGGYVSAAAAKRNGLLHATVLMIIIVAGALVSLLSSSGKESIWSQLAAIVLMAPCAVIGGYIQKRFRQSK